MVGRFPVVDVTPQVMCGRQPAKAAVGEPFEVSAVVVREGHDALNVDAVLTGPDGERRAPVRMHRDAENADRWRATVHADVEGPWSFTVEAWDDPLATWRYHAEKKIPAGVDTELVFTEGAQLLESVSESLADSSTRHAERAVLADAVTALRDTGRPDAARAAAGLAPEVTAVCEAFPLRRLVTPEGPFPFFVDRTLALFGSWYEFFPRSEGAYVDEETGKVVSGTFRTAAERLEGVAAMGFDIVYLPPIHPIGKVNRKGPNTAEFPGGDPGNSADGVGSPWAIGSEEGGHDAVHPDLGTLEDFDAFVARAGELGLEVALDLALQAAPDHPWVKTNPEFFTTRLDGTIAYAENPPKKYQDIYPMNFDNDPEGVYAEVLRVVRHWMDHGVRVFRVDNPHTKPVAFWERLFAEIRGTDPDVIFLSEAFTKPAMMHALGKVGFHQSYTYFTWRNDRWSLESYLHEVSHESSEFLRPNFFVNTPDILHEYLQYGGPAAYRIRATIAATSVPSWGMYAGFELYEHVAVRPGSEEYRDSEKYQIRIRDWEGAAAEGRTLAPYITFLNRLRREHPALQLLRNITIHRSDSDSVLAYSKTATDPDGTITDAVIVVVNTDPHGTRETTVHLNMPALGMDWTDGFVVHDEISGEEYTWWEHNYVRLDPYYQPAHILTIRRPHP